MKNSLDNFAQDLSWQHLTEDQRGAQRIWQYNLSAIKEIGREDILEHPVVLDLGSGAGEFSKNLNSQGINCVGLDINQGWKTNPDAKQVRGSAYHMPFADCSFDIVHGRGVFDPSVYKHDFSKLLLEIARVLKPKGILSVYEDNRDFEIELRKTFEPLTKTGKEHPALWGKK